MNLFCNNMRSSKYSNLFSFCFTDGSYKNIFIGVTVQEYIYTTTNLFISKLNSIILKFFSGYFD